MNRRRILKFIGLPAAVGAGYVTAARSHNRYYQGPVSDHFNGVRFFSPGQPQDKGVVELMRWQLGGGRKDWPESFPSPFQDKPPAEVRDLRVTLIGHASFLIQAAHPSIPVETRDWGGSADLGGGVTAHVEPAYHWSARGINDRRMALWCAYVLTPPAGAIYHIGDTGFGDGRIFH